MALEWVVLSYAAAAEAMMVLLLTLPPSMNPLRKGIINLSNPDFTQTVSYSYTILLIPVTLMDIYWKFETRPSCPTPESCNPTDLMRHQKSVLKSQRNALLIASALVFYWLLYAVTGLVTRAEMLSERVEKLYNRH